MNNFQDEINMQEILLLGKLLHQNGDKVLNSVGKLSLSTTLLCNLNSAFSLIVDGSEDLEASFQVCNSSKIDIFRDLKFLHDFIQKTIGLKLIYCPNNPNIPVDITKFRCLKHLELKKININSVKGLQDVRSQLESIICAGRKGVCTLKQLLANCGGDASIGFIWSSLKHLALPHNSLEQLDISLELVPWLQIIDLSHNLITSADQLSCLPNLKYVNLGYNKLETVPTFSETASHLLQVLVLKNNYIENLNGLQNLECLTELDLSYNCVMEHLSLWPLEKMSALLWISLEGNPLSYHPKYRLLAIKHLHPCLSNSKFVLDHVPLSKSEKEIIAENRLFVIKSKQFLTNEFHTSMSDSLNSSSLFASTSELAGSSNMDKSFSKSKKKSNIKEAIIADVEQEKKETKTETTSKGHLETKKQILEIRKKYGEDKWLSSHAGTFVQDIMGLQPSCPMLIPEFAIENLDSKNIVVSAENSAILLMKNTKIETNEESLMKEINESNNEKENESEVLNKEENISEIILTNNASALVNISQPLYDPEQEEGKLYIVQKKKNADELEDLFLMITSNDIKEIDSLTGKLKYCWSMSSVLSCVLGRSEPVTVDIIFDTTREHRQNRRYFVKSDVAKEIVKIINEEIKKRPMLLKIFKCMKCSTHFSQDLEYVTLINSTISGMKCPTCKSTLVIETDELSILNMENDISEDSLECINKNQYSENLIKANLQHSESYSSIGGMESGAISVTTSLVHSDSHTQAQVCCSATSLEESRESTPSANTSNKKYESDIEVLSNPSQSSIEVLDDASRTHLTPHRKRSSEERRTAIVPSLLTIPDVAPIITGLTESSSSGSLTDSICTAYENKIMKQVNADEKSLNSNNKEIKFTPVTNLTSMLGGLLQSIKIGNNKPLMLKEETSHLMSSNIQYSYTDFNSIDHRIKLHIILNIFEHENEELILLLRAEILMQNTKETFPGCLVLSTFKVYVLKIVGIEGENPQRWLHKEISWTIDRLKRFSPIPFKQGILIELEQPNKINDEPNSTITFLCVLQDLQRTLNFLVYVTDFLLPSICEEVELTVSEYCTSSMYQLLKDCKNYQDGDTVRHLALFSSAILKYQNLEVQLKLSSLIVTTSVLALCNMQWLLPGNKESPHIIKEQAMSNLIGVEHYNSSLTLNFLDEVIGQEETWILDFVSMSAAEIVVTSIRSPWEELFSIPLQNTICKSQNCENE
ncbi:serine/threonine-protein kinase 11-interacting protein isoform X1 [Apis laboriosa]|uniref:serine/threonine-protein kinase 11-interacting protein isoform X1 n=1 Tax=Apis laboriosa TaxID=183418 RepID=UPI001CC33519|nr:serine/threonine-protein kinase 11-interacting protein isoform X1 [Apis laboriosa]XP_043786379.1 serine/threonine-protein kinase 11-interacting protein isoform X1 [Apis laboriosa]XP_043786380.1 serine/threonine-protein kinase 11-interacting protein isoform X1 [Apis laboriosa]